MKHSLKFIVLVLVGNLLMLSAFGQEKNYSLEGKKVTIQRENVCLKNLIEDLVKINDVPIGFEENDTYRSSYVHDVGICGENEPKFTINVKDQPLKQVLDEIVSKMKDYKWEINDDVVNFIPTADRDEKVEQFLNTRIKNFKIENYEKINSFDEKIYRDRLKNLFLVPELRGNMQWAVVPTKNLDLEEFSKTDFSGLTLREIFNKLTRIKRGSWHVKILANTFYVLY